MAYSETLAARVREAFGGLPAEERKMFGGMAFLVRGHMCVGILGDELLVRVGRHAYEAALGLAHARPMDFTGRPLTGIVYVAAAGLRTRRQLETWMGRGLDYVQGLPPKGNAVSGRRTASASRGPRRKAASRGRTKSAGSAGRGGRSSR